MRLSVIIPAYNEEQRLPKTLEAVDGYLRRQSYDYEIVVVDSASIDGSIPLVKSMLSRIKNLWLLQTINRGKGHAVREGMLASYGDFRIFMDADNATSVDQVEKMWPEFEKGFEAVIGSRDVKGAVIAIAQPWWRQRLGDVFNIIVQVVSGLWGIFDTQCGFKGFSAKAAKDIFSKSVIGGWAFDVEALMLAKKMHYKIKEIPVTWMNDPRSKVNFKGMVQMLFEVLFTRFRMTIGKYDF